MSKKNAVAIDRREVFRKIGIGAGVVGATAVGLSATDAEVKDSTGLSKDGAGYRETDHVKKYYELARF